MIPQKTVNGFSLKKPESGLRRFCLRGVVCAFLLASVSSVVLGKEKIVAIKAGKIQTVTQGIIEKGMILVKDDTIVEIGTQISIPEGTEVLDFQDKFIMPGIVSPDSHLGIYKKIAAPGFAFFPAKEPPGKDLAFYPVLFSIYPEHPDYALALKNGLTTLALSPPPTGISGLGAIIRPLGQKLEDVLLMDRAFLRISVYVHTPFWNMLKNSFDEAQTKLEERKAKKEGPPAISESTKIFMEVLEGKIPLLAECEKPDAIAHLLELLSSYPGVRLIIRGGPDTYKSGGLLKEKNIPLIIEPRIDQKESWSSSYPERTNSVLKCQGLDLTMAFQAPGNIEEQIHLFDYLNSLVQLGVKKELLLQGVTIVPARILGIDSHVGSLEKGKKADLIIFRNDPLENTPIIEKVILGGQLIR